MGHVKKAEFRLQPSDQSQERPYRLKDLERIESSKFAGDQKINNHDDDGSHRESGCERNIPCCALIRIDGLPNEEAGISKQIVER